MNGMRFLAACGMIAATLTAAQARPRLLDRLLGAPAEQSETTGGAVAKTLSVGGLERSYLLLDHRRGTGPAPLVIVLHGGGGSPETMIPRWEARARASGLVVAAPKGIGRNDRMGTWNAGGCCGEAVARGVDDVGFVAAVIDDVARQVPIDGRRVYVAGFSNGGMLTHRVAIALGDRIAAAAVVSGALFGNEPAPRAPVPMLIMHGEQDPVVGFEGGMSGTGFVARAQTLRFEPVRHAVDFWRAANGCARPASVTRQPGLTTETGTGCRGNADVVFLDLPQGGHGWPGSGGRLAGGAAGTAPIDATDTIWTFFKAHAR
ncbi:alpha/beta hydrolase family esterase [Methylobacterium sp. sgz302541]|uniref:alpha/beta hydrolase family esterase n=1 Tax=unclassified Methylobacterium TaxID=2615210 RepID=UPI003D357029